VKSISTFLLGSSPEFEVALYTLQYLLNPHQPTTCQLGGYKVRIKTHTLPSSQKPCLAASYIEVI
jgi:hypothetical protein